MTNELTDIDRPTRPEPVPLEDALIADHADPRERTRSARAEPDAGRDPLGSIATDDAVCDSPPRTVAA